MRLRTTHRGITAVVAITLLVGTQSCGSGDTASPASAETAPAYALGVAPTTLTIVAGTSGTAAITISRSNFSGSVTLSVPALPAGITAAFSPNATTSDSSTLTVAVGSSVAAGVYPLTVHGAGAGASSDQSVVLSVTVTAPVTTSGNEVLNFSGCVFSPLWVAYQDGNNAWKPVTGNNSVYQFSLTQPKGAFVYVSQISAVTTETYVFYFAVAESSTGTIFSCPTTGAGTSAMSGAVTGLTAGQTANISFGNSTANVDSPTTTYSLAQLANGTFDLLAWRLNNVLGPSANDRLIVRRDQVVQNGGTIPTLDFGGGEALAPSSGTITVTGAGTGLTSAGMVYQTANCTSSAALWQVLTPASTFTGMGIPAASQRAGDLHDIRIGGASGVHILGVDEFFHTMGNRTIALPGVITTPVVTVLAGNYKRLQATYTLSADYTRSTFQYSDATFAHSVGISATPGYLAGSATTLTMPAFSGLTGFLDSYLPANAGPVTWFVQALGGDITQGSSCRENGRYVVDEVSGGS